MLTATPEAKREQARLCREEGNDFVKQKNKPEALKKYEKGIRLLGVLNYELDEDGQKACDELDREGRELLSVLASNAAQMYMDESMKQFAKAMERCNLAVGANANNAKAYFRRASAAYEHADNLAKGADALLAQAQKDVRKFLQFDAESAAGQNLQKKLARKRQVMQGPILREKAGDEARVEPEWFQEVKNRAIFVCLCGTKATGRDQLYLPETLLSMALQAKDKKAISVGVAYIGYKPPHELEMFTEAWQKKYFRMLQLGERAVKVPPPQQVVVHGEVYNIWSLLEGRVRVMRVNETKKNGEKVGIGWMRYCAQLLWHGEPWVYQTCRPYMRFAPKWDESLSEGLRLAERRLQTRPVLSWISRSQEDEAWQWQSDMVDRNGNCDIPSGTIAAVEFDRMTGWVRWRKRFFNHTFKSPVQIGFFTPHNAFSSSEILSSVPADPLLNAITLHGQVTCENVRLHTHGWDIAAPTANYTWDTTQDMNEAILDLLGGPDPNAVDKGPNPELFDEQKVRADSCVNPWENSLTALDEEMLDMPVPTPSFWTTLRPQDPNPWETGRTVGQHRFRKGAKRTMTNFEKLTGVDFYKQEINERSRNAGFSGDRDFEDSKALLLQQENELAARMRQEEREKTFVHNPRESEVDAWDV